jgi:hypothetical protein
MPYFTDAGPKSGFIRWEHRLDALGVLASPDDHAPIGVALARAMDEDRRSLWRLTVHGAKVSGVFIVVDREFVPARGGGRQDAWIQRAVALGQRWRRTGSRMVPRPETSRRREPNGRQRDLHRSPEAVSEARGATLSGRPSAAGSRCVFSPAVTGPGGIE